MRGFVGSGLSKFSDLDVRQVFVPEKVLACPRCTHKACGATRNVQVVPAGMAPVPRRSHVSLLLDFRDEIFIFGGSGDDCMICTGGDVASMGKVLNANS
jgi:hypothetical protein